MVRRERTKRKVPRSSLKGRSVMGQLMPPVDITSPSEFGELDKRIAIGPVTLVFVYAPWCGHCKRFKPTMDSLENIPNRSVQIARVRDDMYPSTLLASKNKVESYPSLLLVDKEGNATKFKSETGEISNSIPNYKQTGVMEAVVKNMGTPEGLSLITNANSKNEPLGESSLKTEGVNNKAMWTASSQIRSPSPTPEQIPQNIVADRITADNVNRLNTMLSNSQNALLKRSTEGAQQQGGGKRSLFASLTMAAKNLAPASALLFGAEIVSRKSRKSRKNRKSRKSMKRVTVRTVRTVRKRRRA